jgi:membrane protein implicated in regulation of membrane protease activity
MERMWIWLLVGLVMIGSEVLTGAFVLIFFGIAACLTALAVSLGLDNLALEYTLTAVLGVMLTLLFRKRFLRLKDPKSAVTNSPDLHQEFTLSAEIPAKGESSVSYQGTPWTAVNTGTDLLGKGQKVKIIKVDGIKLHVSAIKD